MKPTNSILVPCFGHVGSFGLPVRNVLAAFVISVAACTLPWALEAASPEYGIPVGVGFSSLTGPQGAPFLGSSEGPFTVAPTAGSWFQSMIYGNPGPSIFIGPIGAPASSVLQVTDGSARFTLTSLDYSSNNGDSTYDIEGFLGASLQFHEIGTLTASFSPFHFNTLPIPDSAVQIDGLLIQVQPGPGVSSINLDNINLVSVPEPGLVGSLLVGFALLLARRRQRF